MYIPAIVPLKTASVRTIGWSGTAQGKSRSKRTPISRFRYFIEVADWGKYVYPKAIDKFCIGVIILSIMYFCFRSGAYLTAKVFQNFG